MRFLHVVSVALSVLVVSAPFASAQRRPTQAPPCHPKHTAGECKRIQRAHEFRERELMLDEAYFDYTDQHPWRPRVTLLPSLGVLGLGRGHTKSMWGLSLGAGVQHEMGPTALRIDLLGRLGQGRIRNYDLRDNDSAGESPGVYGLELFGAFVIRPHPFYVGPALATGALFQTGRSFQTVPNAGDEVFSIRIPSRAAFLASGATLGWELPPHGRSDFGFRCMVGAWDTFARPYLQFGFHISAVLGKKEAVLEKNDNM
jgi:hypothetical protein